MKRYSILLAVILCVFLIYPQMSDAKVRVYREQDKIEEAHLIVVAEFIKGKGAFLVTEDTWSQTCTRYATYRIKEVLKGRYAKDTITIDYKKTNDKYKPFTCRAAAYPEKGEKKVVLFLEKNMILLGGNPGKTVLKEETSEAYISGLKDKIAAIKK